MAEALAWRHVQRFLSKKRNVAMLVALVLMVVAGFNYGKPRYLRYVERQYARQAEQFLSKGDFSRAYLRAPAIDEHQSG